MFSLFNEKYDLYFSNNVCGATPLELRQCFLVLNENNVYLCGGVGSFHGSVHL
jgi:hypothetical protein